MSLTADLPDETVRRLAAEAERRGADLADLIADLAAQLRRPRRPRAAGSRSWGGASGTGITPRMDDLLAEGSGQD
jgi:hypothetical protein